MTKSMILGHSTPAKRLFTSTLAAAWHELLNRVNTWSPILVSLMIVTELKIQRIQSISIYETSPRSCSSILRFNLKPLERHPSVWRTATRSHWRHSPQGLSYPPRFSNGTFPANKLSSGKLVQIGMRRSLESCSAGYILTFRRICTQRGQPGCHSPWNQRWFPNVPKLSILSWPRCYMIATNGVVLATEKKSSSPLIDTPSLSKVSLITPDIGMVYSGMGPDYRVLVDKARKVSHTAYKRIYNEYPPTRILVQDVARVVQEATQSGGVRPYGVSLLIAGWDDGVEPETEEARQGESEAEKKKASGKTGGILKGGPSLYQVDPSGSYFPWKATAIGKSATSAKTFLEKRYTEGLELEDAVHIALLTLKETIEGEMNGDTVEIGQSTSPFCSRRIWRALVMLIYWYAGIVGAPADHLMGFEGVEGAKGPRFRKLTKEEIEDYLTNLWLIDSACFDGPYYYFHIISNKTVSTLVIIDSFRSWSGYYSIEAVVLPPSSGNILLWFIYLQARSMKSAKLHWDITRDRWLTPEEHDALWTQI